MGQIKTIGVVGAGTMGSGIAQVAAQSGFEVILNDVRDEFVQRGVGAIDGFLAKGVSREKLTPEQKGEVLGRIRGTTLLEDMADADFVVEVVLEDLALKKSVFEALDGICRPEVVLTTNTSSMSITLISEATKRAERVAGMHFFNPAPLMKLVEVIRGYATGDETIATVSSLARALGKEPVEVKVDSPGFIVNRLMMPHFLEAVQMVQEGVATVEDIDKAVKLGLNYPMGPFELMDYTGIDISGYVADYLHQELNKELKWVQPTLLKNIIRAGRLGKKTGKGWYEYGES